MEQSKIASIIRRRAGLPPRERIGKMCGTTQRQAKLQSRRDESHIIGMPLNAVYKTVKLKQGIEIKKHAFVTADMIEES